MASASIFTNDEKMLIVLCGFGESNVELSRSALIDHLRTKKGTMAIIKKLSSLTDSEYQSISTELLDSFVAGLGIVSN